MPTRAKRAKIDIKDVPDGFNCDHVATMLGDLRKKKAFDYGLKIETVHESAWSAELRITMKSNQKGTSDKSMVWFASGAETPEVAVLQTYNDAMRDLQDLGYVTTEDIEEAFMKE
jgi:hypothetical protein